MKGYSKNFPQKQKPFVEGDFDRRKASTGRDINSLSFPPGKKKHILLCYFLPVLPAMETTQILLREPLHLSVMSSRNKKHMTLQAMVNSRCHQPQLQWTIMRNGAFGVLQLHLENHTCLVPNA